jgi:hypothetical protein
MIQSIAGQNKMINNTIAQTGMYINLPRYNGEL